MKLYLTVEKVGTFQTTEVAVYDVLSMLDQLTSGLLDSFAPIEADPFGLPSIQTYWPDIGQMAPGAVQMTPAFYVINSRQQLIPFRIGDFRATFNVRAKDANSGADWTNWWGTYDEGPLPAIKVNSVDIKREEPLPLQAMIIAVPTTDAVRNSRASSNLFVPGFPSRNRNVGVLSDGLVGAKIASSQYKQGWTFHMSPECQVAGQSVTTITPWLNVPGPLSDGGQSPYNVASLLDYNGGDVIMTGRLKFYLELNIPDSAIPQSGTALTETYIMVPTKGANANCLMSAGSWDGVSYQQRAKTLASPTSYFGSQPLVGIPLSVIASGSTLRGDYSSFFQFNVDDGLAPNPTPARVDTVVRASGKALNPYSEEVFTL